MEQAQRAKEAAAREKERATHESSWKEDLGAGVAEPLPGTPAAGDVRPPPSALKTPASHGRVAGLRLGWESPFARPSMSPFTKPVWGKDSDEKKQEMDDDDADMQSVSGMSVVAGDSRIANAPTLPVPPRYKGATRADRRKFMEAYDTYSHSLKAFETTHSRPFCMPVSACIEERTRWLIAAYEFQKPAVEITESMWIAYFMEANEPDINDYGALDDAMKRLRMNTSIADGGSRVNQLVWDMHDIAAKYGLEQKMITKEPRKLVKYLVDALYPQDFIDKIKARLELEENKNYRKDPAAFARWISEAMRGYIEWEKFGKTTVDSKANDAKSAKNSGRGSTGSSGAGASSKAAAPAAAKSPAAAAAPAARGARTGGTRPPCLKCQSPDHLVRQCPQVGPGEADRLLAELASRKRVARVAVPDTAARASAEPDAVAVPAAAPRDRGTTRASVAGVLEMEALLDTGADVSLVTRAVLDRLESAGCFLEIRKAQAPVKLVPVGTERMEVTHMIRLRNVTLTTTAGPLVLPPVECWVDDHTPGESLILGRTVMAQLGYRRSTFVE